MGHSDIGVLFQYYSLPIKERDECNITFQVVSENSKT